MILVLALSTVGCGVTGPSESVEGHWIARSIGHSSQVGFTLHQTGDSISGTACAMSDGVLLYSGAPVFGDYPDVQFTVSRANAAPCCLQMAGTRFTGKQDSTKDIVGSYGAIDLRFQRSMTSLCQ
ncbi:MAG TPA: hypothetical protein VM096_20130 [Vicinamibacterales bacterium]|nr:hypothetical protein [Vicinamibacterales bacterium]